MALYIRYVGYGLLFLAGVVYLGWHTDVLILIQIGLVLSAVGLFIPDRKRAEIPTQRKLSDVLAGAAFIVFGIGIWLTPTLFYTVFGLLAFGAGGAIMITAIVLKLFKK